MILYAQTPEGIEAVKQCVNSPVWDKYIKPMQCEKHGQNPGANIIFENGGESATLDVCCEYFGESVMQECRKIARL